MYFNLLSDIAGGLTPPLQQKQDNFSTWEIIGVFSIIAIISIILIFLIFFIVSKFRSKQHSSNNDTTQAPTTEKVKHNKIIHKTIATFIIIILLLSLALGIIKIISCANTQNSNKITVNGIYYEKATFHKNGTTTEGYTVTGCNNDIKILNIADKINELPVIDIKKRAFLNNKNLTEVSIPNSITSFYLCSAPFSGCTNIEKITMATSDVMLLFTDYGSGEMNLNITVPAALHYVYLSEGCTKIDTRDFYHCSNIREIHIPQSVTTIKDGTNSTNIGVNGNTPPNGNFLNLPFVGCTNLRIYCAAKTKPNGWDTYWNFINESTQAEVIWGTY